MPVKTIFLDGTVPERDLGLPADTVPTEGFEEILFQIGSARLHYHQLPDHLKEDVVRRMESMVEERPNDETARWIEVAFLENPPRQRCMFIMKNQLVALLTQGAAPHAGAYTSIISGSPKDWLLSRRVGEALRV